MTADDDRRRSPTGPAEGETDVDLGARRSRWWAAGAVAGVLALLAAGAVAAGGRANRAVDTTTSTTTSTTAVQPSASSDRPPIAAPAVTTVPARTTIDGAPFVEVSSPPGLVLYGVGRSLDRLWRVDLLTGETTTRPVADLLELIRDGAATIQLLPRAGGVVLQAGDGPAVFVPDDLDATPVVLERYPSSSRVLSHADPSLLWRIDEGAGGTQAQVIDLGGAPVGAAVAVPGGRIVGDDGTGRLVVSFAGGAYVLGLDGSAALLTHGQPVAVARDRVVELTCDEAVVACEVVARRRVDGSEIGRARAPAPLLDGVPAFLSPLGTSLVVVDRRNEAVVRVPFDGGDVVWSVGEPPPASPDGREGVLWWVDDDLVCGGQAAGHVRCWRSKLGSFLLPDLAPAGFATVALSRT